jgi:acid phosphatase family membrane protein YuiD
MQLLRDYLFLIPVVVMVLSEAIKVGLEGLRTGNWHEGLFRPGGMPSTHSAFVTSLAIVVWQKLGPEAPEFAIAFCFACIVWYDAVVVRKAVGDQGRILNRLQHRSLFRERVGHSVMEVFGGIAFGAAVTILGILLRDELAPKVGTVSS